MDAPDQQIPPLWNPDGAGLRGGNRDQPFAELEPATGNIEPMEPDEGFAQPGVVSGSDPQSPAGTTGHGTAIAVRAVVIDPGTSLPTTVTLNVLEA